MDEKQVDIDMISPHFAKISSDIFKNMNIDIESIIHELKNLTDFHSFTRII